MEDEEEVEKDGGEGGQDEEGKITFSRTHAQ